GLHPPRGKLGRFMADTAAQALEDVDAVVLAVEATAPPELDAAVLDALRAVRAPAVLALHKVHRRAHRGRPLPPLGADAGLRALHALVPLAAADGRGVDRLEAILLALLPPGPPLYPPDTLTDQPETFFVGETIREQLFLATRHEVPYASAVRVDEVVDRGPAGPLYLRANVFVERGSQKAIVIRDGGRLLKPLPHA